MGYFELVNEVSESDTEYRVPPSLAKELGEINTAILEGQPMVHQLKMLKQRYPQYPQIFNMLSAAYMEKEDYERAYQVNQDAFRLFPDYIFSRVNMMQEFINKDDLEKAAAIFDPASTIDQVFPKRKRVHNDEYIGFQKTRALYYAKADMPEEFLDVVHSTEDRIEDEIVLLQFRSEIMEIIDMFNFEEYDIISDYTHAVNEELNQQLGITGDEDFEEDEFNANEYDESIQTDLPPAFNHPEEIEPLYEYGFDIPQAVFEKLLSLPQETLIADLYEVLNDAVRRYEFYSMGAEDDDDDNAFLFPWHAMNLLRTIKDEKAVANMLYFLEQGMELNEFYLGDLTTEALWQVFYPFCISNKEEMVSFLKRPNVYAFCKLPVMHAFTQNALNQPAYRQEVSELIGELLSFFLENKEDQNLLDPSFMSLLCEEVMDGGFIQLKLLVKNVYDNMLEDGWYEDYKEWEEQYNLSQAENMGKLPLLNWQNLNAKFQK